MIESQNSTNQLTAEVLQLLGDFLNVKKKHLILKSWIDLKNYSLQKTLKSQSHNFQYSRALSLNGSSELADGQKIHAKIYQSTQGSKQTSPSNQAKIEQQQKRKANETQFEDMVIQRIFYLETIVNEMKGNLQRKQLKLSYIRDPIGNGFAHRRASCDLILCADYNLNNQNTFVSANHYFNEQLQRNSANSEFFSKTEILGQMFDDQAESVKKMIQAIKQRQPSIIANNKRNQVRISMPSQADFDSYNNSGNKRFDSIDDGTMSAPGFQNQQILSVSEFYQGIQKSIHNYKSRDQIPRQIQRVPRFSIQIKNNIIQNGQKLNEFQFDVSQKGKSKPSKPNFRRRKQCEQIDVGTQRAEHKITKTDRGSTARFSRKKD